MISSNSWPPIKKCLFNNVCTFCPQVHIWFWKQEMELFKQEMELLRQDMELFLPLPGIWSKTSLITYFPCLPRSSKLVFKTGNIIIAPTSRLPIKKLLLQHLLHFFQGVQNRFSKQEMELFKQEMELLLPLPVLWSKNFFNKNSLISTQEFKIDS